MKNSTKLIISASLLGALGLASAAYLVQAEQLKIPAAIVPESRSGSQKTQASDGDDEIKDNLLEKVSDAGEEVDDNAKEQANDQRESEKLEPLAKITAQQAQNAAETGHRGKSSSVKLENENGNLVYSVVIGQKEVTVDAGNGQILYTERLNQPEDKKAETSRPRSSIQISEAPSGDGDGETNDDG
jgi:uncharacterized membrane protein YkoI